MNIIRAQMFLAATIQSKIIGALPLVFTYVFFGLSLICILRGIRMLTKRYRMRHEGLHASSALLRHKMNGEAYYLPVFSYFGRNGEVFDIMGEERYATEAEALKARRPPVFADERPDAGIEVCSALMLVRPALLMLLGGCLLAAMVYSMSLLPK